MGGWESEARAHAAEQIMEGQGKIKKGMAENM